MEEFAKWFALLPALLQYGVFLGITIGTLIAALFFMVLLWKRYGDKVGLPFVQSANEILGTMADLDEPLDSKRVQAPTNLPLMIKKVEKTLVDHAGNDERQFQVVYKRLNTVDSKLEALFRAVSPQSPRRRNR